MPALRILIVDDNVVIGALIAEILQSAGHDVCGVVTTQGAAITSAAALKPDVMIVDARLGQGSGVEAIAQILLTGPMPHLFISGGVVDGAKPEAIILRKPFMQEELEQAIQLALLQPASAKSLTC